VGVTAKTVKNYLQYLEMSYQTITLQPYEKNATRRLIKSPKIHYLDNGVLQAVIGKRGMPTGSEFESLVIAELYKQARQTELPLNFYHLRTANGSEVDCLIETEAGYYAFEIKQTEHVQPADSRHLRSLGDLLDKPLIHAFVLSNDIQEQQISPNITALHVAQFLG
jgi:predicted AAA+ superfamily ATPase